MWGAALLLSSALALTTEPHALHHTLLQTTAPYTRLTPKHHTRTHPSTGPTSRAAHPLLRGGAAPAPSSLWRAYLAALEHRPMRTKMATAALLGGIGDAFAQLLTPADPFSAGRLLALVLVNIVYITPLLSVFYATNEWLSGIVLRLPADTVKGTGLRLAIDQLVNAPMCIYGFFWAYRFAGALVSLLSGSTIAPVGELVAATLAQIRTEYRAMILSNWKVWVLPQMANFRLVPVPLRVPFASGVALIWNVVQSIIANR